MLRDAFLSRLRSPGRPTVSVEFFPPKKPEEAAAMLETARALQPLGIDFASRKCNLPRVRGEVLCSLS